MVDARASLWESGHDETVEVNQRALIDKVLARYSGEFTVFRELLQNSDDAGARSVEIRFETNAYLERQKGEGHTQAEAGVDKEKLPDLKTALVHQWSFRNNGIPFRDEDWSRLKKIAEGNPDEEKIGAFGVGFYSLFSVTEEPWVTSGDQWMNFYWKDKKDQLFARRGKMPSSEGSSPDPWTTFQMTLREPAPIPPAFDFVRFLASSITFMVHLSEVSVYFDDKRLVRLSKDASAPQDVPMLRGLKSKSPSGIMTVKSIQSTPLHIQAEVVRWVYSVGTEKPALAPKAAKPATSGFFSSLFGLGGLQAPQRAPTPVPVAPKEETNLLEVHETSVVLSIFTANVDVQLDKKMTAELQRSTKKNPPSKVQYGLIYTGKDEYDASVKAEEKMPFATGSVFQGLRADLEGTGSARIFIGHATGQTTGIGGHMAARFIPTVERESVDLVDRNVAVWNKELLYVGGFLARSAYETELGKIKDMWTGVVASSKPDTPLDPEFSSWLTKRALHALKFFTFHQSTPSSVVSSLMETAFFTCATYQPFSIISSEGILSAADVRMPDATFTAFLRHLPVVPQEVSDSAKTMISALRGRGMIKDITFADVIQELDRRPLSEAECVACLKWWVDINKQKNDPATVQARRKLLDNTMLSVAGAEGAQGKIIPLSTIQSFLNPRKMGSMIPTDGPLPDHLLPLTISRAFDPDVLSAVFPWHQFTIPDWIRHVVDPSVASANKDFDLTASATWAERIIVVISRAWPSLPKRPQEEIVALLKDKAFIPTSVGMKAPGDAYFANVNLFKDLPVVTLPSGTAVKGPMEKVLQSLGVRKHVELQLVFDRMIKTGDWTIIDLVKYLVSAQSTLTELEIERLTYTAAFPRQATPSDQSSKGQEPVKVARYKASDLYEPLDVFRELGLPVIDWGTENKWKPSSEEAKFLYSLGLKRSPPLWSIIQLAAGTDPVLRSKALKYFLDNFTTKYSEYDPYPFRDLAFIPAVKGPEKLMAKPLEVFANHEWAILGFTVIDPELHADVTKLKINAHPPTSRLVTLLEKSPPLTEKDARLWFEVLATRITDFTPTQLQSLSVIPFVPTKPIAPVQGSSLPPSAVQRLPPSRCYFAGASGDEFHSKLFVFVDFGSRANAFLSACGTKHEPSVEEIVQILLANPRQFYELADGRENYLSELRNIAVNRKLLSSSTIARMKRTNILLGSRRIRKKQTAKSVTDVDEDEWDFQDDLLKPESVVVADDTNAYQLFGDSIFSAPQEDLLEEFYIYLGSPRLSVLMREEYKVSSEVSGTRLGQEMKALILQRLPLFLHEHSHARTRLSYNWLNTDKNFVVRVFGKLKVNKSLHHGTIRLSQEQDASAAAKRDGKGPIELWLANNTQPDMYEVSISLCRLLFDSPKVNDALLFMTILSTDLRALQRRGYNVARILRQQNADREAAQKAARELVEGQKRPLASDATPNEKKPFVSAAAQGQQQLPIPNAAENQKRPLASDATSSEGSSALQKRPLSMVQNLRKLVGRGDGGRDSGPVGNGSAEAGPSILPESKPIFPGGRPGGFGSPAPANGVTPLSNIESNINMAVKACAPEMGSLIRNRKQMEVVKESLNEGYCDISGRQDMDLVGSIQTSMGPVKFFAAHDVPNRDSVVHSQRECIDRFIRILEVLAGVYKLPMTSLHIFMDTSGPTIAFNRNGSLFMNLRYYQAWHDRDVQEGEFSKALISWYFTLAHEIAHNLVQQHNSEHEFYFSSVCEQYLSSLTGFIAR